MLNFKKLLIILKTVGFTKIIIRNKWKILNTLTPQSYLNI